ncbi:MAG: type II toxin-antitoxin system VapB family antitoxin [Thiolinea sp.]
MATNLALDDALIAEAQSISQHKTKKAVVTEALQEYIQRRKQQEIIKLFGQIEYEEDYDYKRQRLVP